MPLGNSKNNIIQNKNMAMIGNTIKKKTIGPRISNSASKKLDNTCVSLVL